MVGEEEVCVCVLFILSSLMCEEGMEEIREKSSRRIVLLKLKRKKRLAA